MIERTAVPAWERYAPIGGVVFVALDVVVAVLGGEPPASDASPAELTRYYLDHSAGIEAGLWLFGIAAIALMLWFAGLWRWMVRTEQGTPGLAVASLLGLSIAGSLALASSAVWASLARGGNVVAADLETMHTLGATLSSAAGIGVAAHLLATNYIAIAQRALPTWVAITGLASAAGWIINTIAASTSTDDTNTTVGLGAFALWCIWILAVSYRLRARPSRVRQHTPAIITPNPLPT